MNVTGEPKWSMERDLDMEMIVDHLSACLLIIQHYELGELRGSIEEAMAAALKEADARPDMSLH